MIIKKIFLRALLSEDRLRKSLRRVINNVNLTQYVNIQTKLMLNGNEDPTQLLGKNFIIDISSKNDKAFYISTIIQEFTTKYVNENDTSKVTGIQIQCIQSSIEDYNNFIKKLNQDN